MARADRRGLGEVDSEATERRSPTDGRPLGRSRTSRAARGLFAALALTLTAVVVDGCSTEEPPIGSGAPGSPGVPGVPACHDGLVGCSCTTEGAVAPCGQVLRKDGDFVTCGEGTSSCTGGHWSSCTGDHVVVKSLQSATGGSGAVRFAASTSSCNDVCDPNCQIVTSAPMSDVDAAGIAAGEGGVTLPGSLGTTGPACSGLQCSVAACGGNTDATTLTGKVYDPAGNVPLYDAFVYVPVNSDLTKLPAFPDAYTNNVSCDTCSGATLSAVALAQTDATGSFTLKGVPSGSNIPLVVQMGKWRRAILLSTVTACQANTVTNNCTATDKSLCVPRLPRNQTDGYNPSTGGYTSPNGKADLPRIAMVSGSADPFECMLLKAGIDPNEFGSYDKNTSRRFHFYESPDAPGSSLDTGYGNQITSDVLWNDPAQIKKYDGVILACEGSAIDKSVTGKAPYKNVIDYTNLGGRVFATHYSYVWLQYPKLKASLPDWQSVATWTHSTGTTNTQDPLTASIVTSFPKGSAFSDWLTNVGASTVATKLDLHEARQDLTTVGASTQSWMTATDSKVTSNKDFSPQFAFNTPYGASASSQCGRVVFSDFHVSASALINTQAKCYANSDCGFTATCQGSVPAGLGTCSEPCLTNSDCSTGYTCNGGSQGSCAAAACTTKKPKVNCKKGTCSGAPGVCNCTKDSQCGSGNCNKGVCDPQTCGSDSDCGKSEVCSGGALGQCTKSCATNADCTNGEVCTSGKCSGCTTTSQCTTRNFPGTCNGGSSAVAGTCKVGSVVNNDDSLFPEACRQGQLSPQEKALEFLFFDLTACVTPDSAPPPVPTTTFTAASFTQDYTGTCASGSTPVWREVDWQAVIPSTASIDFAAQSGPSFAALKPAVALSLAHATTTTATPAYDVAYIDTGKSGNGIFNKASPPVASDAVLRLKITLNPTSAADAAPTLKTWKVIYDCVPTQ